MGFLIRSCFWIALAFLFIPFATVGADGESTSAVNPLQTLMAARDAIADIAAICDRQPEVCETVAAISQTVITRASEGMRLAQQLIDGNRTDEHQPTPKADIPDNSDQKPTTTGSIH